MFNNLWPSPAAAHPLHSTHTGRNESDAVVTVNQSLHKRCSNCTSLLLAKPSFHCKECDFHLCTSCDKSYEHPIHREHRIYRVFSNILGQTRWSWNCIACRKGYNSNIVRYHCPYCSLDFCEECFASKQHPLHIHPVTKTDVHRVYTKSMGKWFCDNCTNNNGPANYFPLHCNRCQYDLCDNCVKPWFSSAHPQHGLLKADSRLVYPRYNGGWKCDRCTASFRPEVNNKPFHCVSCEFDLCENCMRTTGSELNNVGFDVPASFLPQAGENDEAPSVNRSPFLFAATERGDPIASPLEDITVQQIGKPGPTSDDAGECVVCLDRPKDATIVHGQTGHVCCCTKCALELQGKGSSCPICRAPIERVIKQYTV